MQTLRTESKPLYASEIAEELDCSYQLIGKRGKNLVDRGLVDRSITEQRRPQFELSSEAEDSYFKPDFRDELDIEIEEE
jgi:predicted transcriptional regulator